MKIAYFSPFNPQRTGISDYSEELLPLLSKYADFDLFVDGYEPVNKELVGRHKILNYSEVNLEFLLPNYDIALYQMGNNAYHEYIFKALVKYPGVVVMHDYDYHHLVAKMTLDKSNPQGYIEEMRYNYGDKGVSLAKKTIKKEMPPLCETSSLEFPLNKRIIDSAEGIIVHSDFVYDLVRKENSHVPITRINHPSLLGRSDNKNSIKSIRQKLGLPLDKLIVCSFGLVTPARRIEVILKALARLISGFNIYCVLVGDFVPACNLLPMIRDLGLKDHVRITGHVDSETFLGYMAGSDICIQLRFPTQGETSGSVSRILGIGKPLIASNVGWFSEIPDNCCAKVDVDENEEELLAEYLKVLMRNEALRRKMGENAQKYAKENLSLEESARAYIQFLQKISDEKKRTVEKNLISDISVELSNMGVRETDENIIENIAKEIRFLVDINRNPKTTTASFPPPST